VWASGLQVDQDNLENEGRTGQQLYKLLTASFPIFVYLPPKPLRTIPTVLSTIRKSNTTDIFLR
jgi:hypothetical protein